MFDSDSPQSSYGGTLELILIGLATVSSLISLLIPALYHIKKQCREHPTNLISKISLLEALSNYNVILIAVNIYKFQDYINIRNIFDVITFNQPQQPTDTEFCEINYILYMILELSSIAYNISFSIDLLITLKFPFYAGKKRMKYYNLFAVLFLLATMPQAIIQAYDICENQFHNKAIYKVPIIFIVVLAIFYGISFFVIIYSFLQIKKLGKVRAQYIRHHRFILIILLSAWLFPLWTNILIYIGDEDSSIFYTVNLLSFITLLLLGAFVNIVRFYHDRFLWVKVKKMIKFQKTVIKNKPNGQNIKEQLDIWNVPLATAVAQLNNQKVVHSLVQVVTYACSECQIDKLLKIKSQQEGRSQSIATLTARQRKILQKINSKNSIFKDKADLQQKFIERNVQNSSLSDLKKISKRKKKFNMFCLQDNPSSRQVESHLTLKQKTVFAKQKQKISPSQFIDSPVRKRAGTDLKNHLSLITDKEINKLRDQFQIYANTQSIDVGQNQTKITKEVIRNEKQENIQIKVVSYAHTIFSSIRKLYGLEQQVLQESLNLQNNIQSILKAKQSLGASGSFFFFSYDNRLIIKTIEQGQDTVLLNFLPQYYLHLKKYKDSLLTKIFGLFSVQIAGISKITFILLENSFEKMQNQNIKYKKYDLKGSTVQRQVKNPKASVLKDLNYLKSSDAFIMMSPQERQKLINQIEADITLLRNQNIMDYSLLLGVGVRTRPKSDVFENQNATRRNKQMQKQKQDQMNFQRDILRRKRQGSLRINKMPRHSLRKNSKFYEKSWRYIDDYEDISSRIYSISIIDYLQEFNFNKYMQLQLKKLFRGGGDISSVDSQFYFERFLNFVKKIAVPVKNIKRQCGKLKQDQKRGGSVLEGNLKEKKKTIYQVKINQKWESVYLKQE